MSPARIFIGALVGGIAVFAWGATAHMVLPLGKMGIKSMPEAAEIALLPAMKAAIGEKGFYFFPGMDWDNMTEETQKVWEEKIRRGPQGLLLMNPGGGEPMCPNQLITEYLSNAAACFLLAILLSRIGKGKAAGAVFGAAIGIFAWLSIDVSYWNWYGFPFEMIMASFVEQTVGGLLGGVVVAMILGPKRFVPPMMGQDRLGEFRMIDTAKVAEHRKLRFKNIDDCIAEVDRIVASDKAGTLRRLGNWTVGQNFAHLASWIEYAYVGFPLKPPPFFIRWILKLMVKKYSINGMPKGVKIPGIENGTHGMDDMPTAEAAERYKTALMRLKNGEPPKYHSPGFGPVSEEMRTQLMLRHAELHLGFLVP